MKKLQTLGFDIQRAKENKKKYKEYERIKELFVALELNGKAYQEYLAKEQAKYDLKVREYNPTHHHKNFEHYIKYAKSDLKRAQEKHTRLFVVDASKEYLSLRS